jgi:hypothetical protein
MPRLPEDAADQRPSPGPGIGASVGEWLCAAGGSPGKVDARDCSDWGVEMMGGNRRMALGALAAGCLAAALSAGGAQAREDRAYLVLDASKEELLLMDVASIGGSGDLRRGWATGVFAKPQDVSDGKAYVFETIYVEFNCAERKYRFLAIRDRDEAFQLVYSDDDQGDWGNIEPSTLGEAEMNAVCKPLPALTDDNSLNGDLPGLREAYLKVAAKL